MAVSGAPGLSLLAALQALLLLLFGGLLARCGGDQIGSEGKEEDLLGRYERKALTIYRDVTKRSPSGEAVSYREPQEVDEGDLVLLGDHHFVRHISSQWYAAGIAYKDVLRLEDDGEWHLHNGTILLEILRMDGKPPPKKLSHEEWRVQTIDGNTFLRGEAWSGAPDEYRLVK